mmetsp:Transcript_16732/g.20442  ORF Transcript_16732/g.20442 Transcript_16732/m.20442 type:complete len:361 (+) Transcript_16732:102-1184(+)
MCTSVSNKRLEGEKVSSEEASVNDIICGRGTKYCSHEGNKRYHLLVGMHCTAYSKAECKEDKTQLSRNIVASLRESGVRFIQKSGKGWIEIGDKKAWEKTSQLLREMVAKGNHKTVYQKRKFDKELKKKERSKRFKAIPIQQPHSSEAQEDFLSRSVSFVSNPSVISAASSISYNNTNGTEFRNPTTLTNYPARDLYSVEALNRLAFHKPIQIPASIHDFNVQNVNDSYYMIGASRPVRPLIHFTRSSFNQDDLPLSRSLDVASHNKITPITSYLEQQTSHAGFSPEAACLPYKSHSIASSEMSHHTQTTGLNPHFNSDHEAYLLRQFKTNPMIQTGKNLTDLTGPQSRGYDSLYYGTRY